MHEAGGGLPDRAGQHSCARGLLTNNRHLKGEETVTKRNSTSQPLHGCGLRKCWFYPGSEQLSTTVMQGRKPTPRGYGENEPP